MKRPAAPHLALAFTALSVLAYVSFWLAREEPSAHQARSAPVPVPAPQLVVSAAPAAVTPPSTPLEPPKAEAAAPRFDEAELMAELRALRLRAPGEALQRAQEANTAHPDSPGAAERTWLIVRSLEDLSRFHEAREVARAMRDRYPGTSWTNDVERHVLIHPLDHPSREAQQAALETSLPAP